MSQNKVKTCDRVLERHPKTMKRSNQVQNQMRRISEGNFPLDIRASNQTVERSDLLFDVGDHAISIQAG